MLVCKASRGGDALNGLLLARRCLLWHAGYNMLIGSRKSFKHRHERPGPVQNPPSS